MVMQPEEGEFSTALGTAVQQVKPNAGTVLSALLALFALSFIGTQHLSSSSGGCFSVSFPYLDVFYVCLEEIILSLRISCFVFIIFVCLWVFSNRLEEAKVDF